jgi:activator of HSP90 ATPase
MSRTIQQTVIFGASPHEVYEALMDSAKHAAFTGDKAKISRKVGGGIKAYGGYISGKNLELIPDKKIVQAWRAVDWPEGHFSTVTFLLTPLGLGTRLDFTHSDIPEGEEDNFAQGWVDNYWEPMKSVLED